MKNLSIILLILSLFVGCNRSPKSNTSAPEQKSASVAEGYHTVVASEVIQSSGYTYIKLKEGDREYWAAVTRMEAEAGKTYYYKDGMEMTNFKSKELNRVFDSIWFIMEFSDQPIQPKGQEKLTTSGRQMLEKANDVKVEPISGSITIAQLFSERAKYAGKSVKIRAKVVKFSPEIMQKNWLHLQDGTDAGGQFDLTVTTMEVFQPGDIVTLEGVIALEKDFGYGYKYDVLMEEAKAVK